LKWKSRTVLLRPESYDLEGVLIMKLCICERCVLQMRRVNPALIERNTVGYLSRHLSVFWRLYPG